MANCEVLAHICCDVAGDVAIEFQAPTKYCRKAAFHDLSLSAALAHPIERQPCIHHLSLSGDMDGVQGR